MFLKHFKDFYRFFNLNINLLLYKFQHFLKEKYF